jgi:uncharacterized protein (DUF736 family)
MSIIGTFKKQDNGFQGTITTLTINAKVRIVAAEKQSDNAPEYRVFIGTSEVGAGWVKQSEGKAEYVSLKLDDPSLSAPLYANLVEGKDRFNLLWNRPKSEH